MLPLAERPMPNLKAFEKARAFINRYGDEAELIIALCTDAAFHRGNHQHVAEWMEILYAIDELRRAIPSPGEATH
jgi:hypothetical protein